MDDFKRNLLGGSGMSAIHPNAQRDSLPLGSGMSASQSIRTGVRLNLSCEPVSLSTDERGLIISNPIRIQGNEFSFDADLDSQHLRFALLFWDKLDWPSNKGLYFGSAPDVDYLISCGVMVRTDADLVIGGQATDIIRESFVSTFRKRDSDQPGKWSLARGNQSLSFKDVELEAGRGILFDLHSAIPIPDRDVHLEDILEFKRKHKDELLSLRFHLEDIYQRVRLGPDQDLAKLTALGALDQSITDFVKASHAFGMPTRLMSLTANLDLRDAIAGCLVAERALSSGLGATTSALAGVAASSISATASFSLGVGLKGRTPTTPFQYVSSIEQKLW